MKNLLSSPSLYFHFILVSIAVTAIGCAFIPLGVNAAETATHRYDALGRLIWTSKSGGPVTGTQVVTAFDPAGNRLHVNVNGAPGSPASPPPVSSIAFSVAGPSGQVQEGGMARFTVSKVGAATAATSVNFQTANGSAQSSSDYTAQSGALSFRNWETAKFVDVVVLTTGAAESAESFSLTLSSPSSGTSIAGSSAIATIAASGSPNQPPVTAYDSIDVGVCSAGQVNVIANDSDPEGGTLTLVSITSASLASVAVGSGGGLVLVNGYGSPGADQARYR